MAIGANSILGLAPRSMSINGPTANTVLRSIAFAWLILVSVASSAADARVLVLREDSLVAKQAVSLIQAQIGESSVVDLIITAQDQAIPATVKGDQVVIALGARAFKLALRHAAARKVIGALLSQSSLDEISPIPLERGTAIVLDQPVERWIGLIQLAFPGIQQIGMLVGPEGTRATRTIERKMTERHISLAVESISSPEDVVSAIERLTPRMALLLALPDSVVHNRHTVQPLLLTTYRAGIPVVAYSESYQQAGAVLALYSTIPQIVAQVAESIQEIKEGKTLPAIQAPKYFTVGINAAVARSLGLVLPPASDIQGRLHILGQ